MGMTGSGMVSGVDDWYLGRRYDWWLDVGDGWAGGGKVIVTVEGVSGGYEKFVGLVPRS